MAYTVSIHSREKNQQNLDNSQLFSQAFDFSLDTALYFKKLQSFTKARGKISRNTLDLLTAIAARASELASSCSIPTREEDIDGDLASLDGMSEDIFRYQNFITCCVCCVSDTALKAIRIIIHPSFDRSKSVSRRRSSGFMSTARLTSERRPTA